MSVKYPKFTIPPPAIDVIFVAGARNVFADAAIKEWVAVNAVAFRFNWPAPDMTFVKFISVALTVVEFVVVELTVVIAPVVALTVVAFAVVELTAPTKVVEIVATAVWLNVFDCNVLTSVCNVPIEVACAVIWVCNPKATPSVYKFAAANVEAADAAIAIFI